MAKKMNKVSNFLINVTKNIISSFFVDILFSFTINIVDLSDHSHIGKNHDKFNDLHILSNKHFEGENKKRKKRPGDSEGTRKSRVENNSQRLI